jgi:hypothetical protein
MNQEQAETAMQRGAEFLRQGEFERAVRLLER